MYIYIYINSYIYIYLYKILLYICISVCKHLSIYIWIRPRRPEAGSIIETERNHVDVYLVWCSKVGSRWVDIERHKPSSSSSSSL